MSTTSSSSDQFLRDAEKLHLLHGSALRKAKDEIGTEQDEREIARRLIRSGVISRWAASQFLKRRSLKWGKYQLIDQIGKDLNSPIYLAEHTQMERRVVLKVLTEAQAGRSELRAVAQLDNRNLVHVFDIDYQNDKYYLVMEYVDGLDLAAIMEQGPPPFENSAAYIYQAAQGLAHAHSHQIVHRQINPRNIMVDHEGAVKILNLDAARPADLLGETGSKVEKLSTELVDYIAPEQIIKNGTIDQRSDLYSLGCVFYQLLTGTTPFTGESISERLKAHVNSSPRPIEEVAPGVPAGLAAICNRMIARSPQDRVETAEQLAAELDVWLTEFDTQRKAVEVRRKPPMAAVGGIQTSGTSPVDRIKASKRPGLLESITPQQKMIAAGVGGVVALLLVVGVIVAAILGGGSPDAAADSTAQLPNSQEPAEKPETPREGGKPPVVDRFPNAGELGDKGAPEETQPVELPPKVAPPDPAPPVDPAPPEGEKPEKVEPVDKPKPTKPKTPETKPEKPVKPVAPPKKSNPFKNFPTAVTLPLAGQQESSDAAPAVVSLGSVKLKADSKVFFTLNGGDVAGRANMQFVAESDLSTTPARRWNVSVVDGDGAQTPVAQFAVAGSELKFRWMPATAENRPANYLRNCSVSLQTSDSTHTFRLREPVQVDPIVLDLDKSRMRSSVALDWLPAAETLMVEFTGVEGEFPKTTWEPGQLMSADGGRGELILGEGADRLLKFQIRTAVKRGFQVDFSSLFKVDSEPTPLAFSKTVAERSANKVVRVNADLTKALAAMNAVKDANKKKALAPRIQAAKEQQAVATNALKQFTTLKELYNGLNGSGKIHFRVYYQAGADEVVLAASQPAEAAEPPE